MTSDSVPGQPRVRVAIQDDDVRERLRILLEGSAMELEVVDPKIDPLRSPAPAGTDLLLVRRSEVLPEDVRLVDAYTNEESNPGLVVLREAGGDAQRARLMAAGASSVLEIRDTNHDLRESLEALAEAEHQGSARGPHSGGAEPEPRLADFLSRSPRMQRFLELVHRVVRTDSSLLLTGETGVGKERLAQAIHNEGARSAGPFISVNCGAIPEQLLESELFGHVAGAFTGANRHRKGRFELADGGTIFLDEIGEMPSHLQVKLLTVLQRRRVQRVGSEDSERVDARVMAATNRDVVEDIKAGRFREDLYYRLNVVTLDIPPLRERPEDIPDLAGRFISHFREALGRREVESISDEALLAMLDYDWPGNVRELVNAIEHAIVLCSDSRITLSDLPGTVSRQPMNSTQPSETQPGFRGEGQFEQWRSLPLREARRELNRGFELSYLRSLLTKTHGRISETAKLAGITPRALYEKMRAHELHKEDFR